MTTEYLKIALDIIILAGLGGFMYYAVRLSSALNRLRDNRTEFGAMIRELNENIAKADHTIQNMKKRSQKTADDLFLQVERAREMKEDLELVNDTAENLAGRLEMLAKTATHHETSTPAPTAKKPAAFAIQDPDFTETLEEDYDESQSDIEDENIKKLPSAAEKELYKALKKAKS